MAEVCDGIDQNGNGLIDDNATDATLWYIDSDLDSYGDPNSTTYACQLAAGISADSTDCDDADASRYPGAPENPNDNIFQDCNLVFQSDQDGDGVLAISFGGNDCDDANANRYPGNTEIWYDGIDQDCDNNDDESNNNDADGRDSKAE